jgi:NAD(P) transhydrogenase subunit alpha
MPFHASLLYANNVINLLIHLAPEGELALDFDDEITAGAVVTHAGEIVNQRVAEAMGMPMASAKSTPDPQADRAVSEGTSA